MTELNREQKYEYIVDTLIKDYKNKASKIVAKLGLIKTRNHINNVLEDGIKNNLLTQEQILDLRHFVMKVEYDLRLQNKTKQDYSDATEFLNSFVEPSRVEVLHARCDELYMAVNYLAKRINDITGRELD